MTRPVLLLLVLAPLLLSPQPAAAEKLDDVDDAARGDNRPSAKPRREQRAKKSTSRRLQSDDEPDNFFLYVLAAPWTIPYYAARISGQHPVFSDRPFEEGCGLFCLNDDSGTAPQKTFSFHVELDGGYELSGFPFAELAFRLESLFGIGLSTQLTGYREPNAQQVDNALMGKSDLYYRFATSRWVQFRSGLGGVPN